MRINYRAFEPGNVTEFYREWLDILGEVLLQAGLWGAVLCGLVWVLK